MEGRPQISVFIASSIDGFIARENKEMDWLDRFNGLAEDYGFMEFFTSIDVIVIGRNTYETACQSRLWPYTGKRVLVLSRTLESVCESAELYKGDASSLVCDLKARGAKHVWIDGGLVIKTFLCERIVDDMTITIAPVILGAGIPLFHFTKVEEECALLGVKTFPSGMVQLSYRFNRQDIKI